MLSAFAGDLAGVPEHGGAGTRRLHAVGSFQTLLQQPLGLCIVAEFDVRRGDGRQQLDRRLGFPGVEPIKLLQSPDADSTTRSSSRQSSGRCLDADLGTIGSGGTKVQVWDCSGGANQSWYFEFS